jgi:sulfur relay (sulfurtransferase) DsrC/TusE family protein
LPLEFLFFGAFFWRGIIKLEIEYPDIWMDQIIGEEYGNSRRLFNLWYQKRAKTASKVRSG